MCFVHTKLNKTVNHDTIIRDENVFKQENLKYPPPPQFWLIGESKLVRQNLNNCYKFQLKYPKSAKRIKILMPGL